jgi:hypothetical protein
MSTSSTAPWRAPIRGVAGGLSLLLAADTPRDLEYAFVNFFQVGSKFDLGHIESKFSQAGRDVRALPVPSENQVRLQGNNFFDVGVQQASHIFDRFDLRGIVAESGDPDDAAAGSQIKKDLRIRGHERNDPPGLPGRFSGGSAGRKDRQKKDPEFQPSHFETFRTGQRPQAWQ